MHFLESGEVQPMHVAAVRRPAATGGEPNQYQIGKGCEGALTSAWTMA